MIRSQTTRVLLAMALLLGGLAGWRGRTALPSQNFFTRATAAVESSVIPVVTVCGPVIEFTAPTASATGLLNIGGVRLTLAAGSGITGFAVGQNVCASFCANSNGQIAGVIGSITANAGGVTTVCGIVTEYNTYTNYLGIGAARLRMEPYLTINGGAFVAPSSNICLYPVYRSDGKLTGGTTATLTPGTLPIHVPAITQGKTLGPDFSDADDGFFRLPEPFLLNVQTPIPSGVEVRQAAAGLYRTPYGLFNPRELARFSSSTPNSTVRATACADSLWDLFVQLQTSGATEGDMITLAVQNPLTGNVQVLAMFTIQGGNAVVTQIHPHVSLRWDAGEIAVGRAIPFYTQNDVARTPTLTMVFQMNSNLLSGCLQYYAEIKRAGGSGTISIIHLAAVLKRMESVGQGRIEGYDLLSGALGAFWTGRPCEVSCNGCQPPPPASPTPTPMPLAGSLSGYVYCDLNNDGLYQNPGESPLVNVTVTLNGFDFNGPVNRVTTTNALGFYTFPNLMPGVYSITETQPPGVNDGIDRLGSLGGTQNNNDMFENIPLPALGFGENYNFGESCTTGTPTPTPSPSQPKCSSICWRDTPWFTRNTSQWPSGTVLAMGFNANNPISVSSNSSTIRIILNGGMSQVQRFNSEFVTAQLSLLRAGGPGSPVVFDTLWSQLRCSGLNFAPVTLSNSVTLSPESLLDTLWNQSVLAIRENRQQDLDELASIWAQLNGQCDIF